MEPGDHRLSSSGMFQPARTPNMIPCAICGTPIIPNRANQCPRCLSARADLTSSLPRHLDLIHCPDCSSYLQPPKSYLRAELESKQLLSICLHRLKKPISSRNLKLVHAEFIWTEPHSKRIQVKIRVQGEIDRNAIIEQSHLVEFKVVDRLCDSCSRVQANPDQWVAKAQLRQHVAHRRTFFYLEQLILRHRRADSAIRIQETDQGIDFVFGNRSHAVKFVDFVSGVVPVSSRSDKSLVSHDSKNNSYNYRYTFSVEICPICREDLVCLPPPVAHSLGNTGPVVICVKVTNTLALLCLRTNKVLYLDAKDYWRMPFPALMVSRQLVEYMVVDIDLDSQETNLGGSKCRLGYVYVSRIGELGKKEPIAVRTHLGHLLSPGDHALGYDMCTANFNNSEVEKYRNPDLQNAYLIKKSYEEKRQRRKGKPRAWKLKSLGMEVDDTAAARGRGDKVNRSDEYEEFLRDLEENPEMRFNISLYRNKDYQPSEMASTTDDDDNAPTVPLDELLGELELSDKEGNDDDSDANSMME